MAEHTPGPWIAEEDDMFGDHNILSAAEGENGIKAAVAAVVSNMRDPEEVAANARLVAAAPELLFALRNLLAVKRGEGATKYHSDRIAEAAIAKATQP